jgi:hypothetical protein
MDISPEIFFTIYLDNKTGQLAAISAALFEKRVSLRGIWGIGTSLGAAQVVCIPEDPVQFTAVAEKQRWNVKEGTCFYLHGQDEPGALVDILNNIAERDLSIVALDALSLDGNFGCYLWGSEDDHVELSQILGLKSSLI